MLIHGYQDTPSILLNPETFNIKFNQPIKTRNINKLFFKSKTQLYDIIQIVFINTIFVEKDLMAESEIGSADFTITKTFIPFFETFGKFVYVYMG